MSLGQDTRVGPYEIVDSIGRGSMGDVYLARDSRLNRNVAIKVISDESADESKRRRFTREARAASALNHPNIVTVHDFGTEDGISYIVSELVEGESLRAVIKGGPVPMKRLLGIGAQIAGGLAAAHEACIVHRDLKPENIMITRDGRVKILDFGLAKPILEGHDGETLDGATLDEAIGRTEPGLILGTVGYMSPEQARGLKVGPQSDQFAFGIILHEMATGHQPFRGATPMETLILIANIDRPPFTPGPVAFRMLVDRCLSLDPDKRFPHTSEIADRLNRIRHQVSEIYATPADKVAMLPATAAPPVVLPAPPETRVREHWWQRVSPRLITAVLGVLALLSASALFAWRYFTPALADPLTFRFVPLATESGLELFPSWSPNGRLIAYSGEQNGVLQIFTRSNRSSLFTQVTRSAIDCYFPFWSPDGTRIYYTALQSGTPALWSVNATGGAPELIAANAAQAAISPDGKTLAMLRGEGPLYTLMLASPPDAEPKQYRIGVFARESFFPWSTLRFSPDGRQLGFWASLPAGKSEFYTIPVDGVEPQVRFADLESSPYARAFSWLPDSTRILFAERGGFSRNDHLWVGDTRNGEVHLVTNGTAREQWPSIAPGGHEAAFASLDFHYDLANLRVEGDTTLPPRDGTEFSEASPSWSPVRDEYAYVTERSGKPEIRLRSTDAGWERTLVSSKDFGDDQTQFLLDLAFAPNGQSLTYRRAGPGNESVWISATSGEPPVRLVPEPGGAIQQDPTWSPDGNWIAYVTVKNGQYVAEKARVGANSTPLVVAKGAGTSPRWSPKGDSIALIAPHGGVNLVAAEGSSVHRIGSSEWLAITWTRHGSRLLGIQKTADRRLALAWLDVNSGAETRISDLGPLPAAFGYGTMMGLPPINGISIAPDGKTVTVSMLRVRSDIWLLQGLSRR